MARMLQEGLEPPTLGLLDPCSTKLSYQSGACRHPGSNQGPSDLQSDALPTELKRLLCTGSGAAYHTTVHTAQSKAA